MAQTHKGGGEYRSTWGGLGARSSGDLQYEAGHFVLPDRYSLIDRRGGAMTLAAFGPRGVALAVAGGEGVEAFAGEEGVKHAEEGVAVFVVEF